jgi:hypothetical protein
VSDVCHEYDIHHRPSTIRVFIVKNKIIVLKLLQSAILTINNMGTQVQIHWICLDDYSVAVSKQIFQFLFFAVQNKLCF